MPLPQALVAKLKKAVESDKDLVAELDKAHEADVSEVDAVKADAAAQKKAAEDAAKAQKKAEDAAKKAAADLETKTKGEGEELAKLRGERDEWKAKAETADTRVNEVKRDAKLREAATKAGLRDLDGLKMLDLEGVSLDDKGELVGADAVFKAAKKAKAYLFDEPGQGGAGGAGGRPPGAGGGQGGQGGAGGEDEIGKAIKAAHSQLGGAPNGGWGNRVGGTALQPPAPAGQQQQSR